LQFPASRLVEGRDRLTSIVGAGSALFAAGYGLVGAIHGFAPLALCVLIFTLGELLVVPSSIALAANLAPEDRRGLTLGAFGFAIMIGRCVGPLVGGIDLAVLEEEPWIHWAIVGCVASVASLVFLVVVRRRVVREADLESR
jgi:DHA1 family multidrug resistance protein-like MFS transporter